MFGGGNCGWKSRAAVPLLRMKAGVAKTSEKLNSDLAECDYLEWVCIRFVCKYSINHYYRNSALNARELSRGTRRMSGVAGASLVCPEEEGKGFRVL